MSSEETVVHPYVIITPRNKISAYQLWASLPPYRLRSIFTCKPVYLKKENIKSAQIRKSVWTFMVANEDYKEIILYAHQNEVQGGFELSGPPPTPFLGFVKHYLLFSPTLLTILLIVLSLFIASQISAHFKSENYLNQFTFYKMYPKELLSIVKTRIVFWSFLVPTSLAPFIVALFSLSGIKKSKIGRVQAAIKVESWLMLMIVLFLLKSFPMVKLIQNTDALFAPLNSPRIEKLIQDQQAHQN